MSYLPLPLDYKVADLDRLLGPLQQLPFGKHFHTFFTRTFSSYDETHTTFAVFTRPSA